MKEDYMDNMRNAYRIFTGKPERKRDNLGYLTTDG
jgi:hypothetical protein